MPGFSSVTGLDSIMFANNVSLDGTERGGAISLDGELLIGSVVSPHIRKGNLSSSDGTVTITNGPGTIDLKAVVPISTTLWTTIAANQTAVVGDGYFCNKAGTLALALPATSIVGAIIEVANINTALGVQFTQAANQQIFIGNTNTTLGVGGTLTSSAVGDTLKLVCRTANLVWQVVGGWGNWSVV